jgi:hypothetical protein
MADDRAIKARANASAPKVMLGYLSAENILAVDGIKKDAAWLERYANPGPTNAVPPHPLAKDRSQV